MIIGIDIIQGFGHEILRQTVDHLIIYSKEIGVLCNITYLSETHLQHKSREISFAHYFFRICPIVLKLGNATAVRDEQDFMRFGFKMSFGRISYVA